MQSNALLHTQAMQATQAGHVNPHVQALMQCVTQSADTINIQKSDELAHWVRALGVSEEQLRMAVAAVGAQVEDVRNHFGVVRTAG